MTTCRPLKSPKATARSHLYAPSKWSVHLTDKMMNVVRKRYKSKWEFRIQMGIYSYQYNDFTEQYQ